MAVELSDCPNALKKRLMQNCCEDCPNLELITSIFNTPSDNVNGLAAWIPAICKHIKCREVLWTYRVACEHKLNDLPIDPSDDVLTLCRKLRTHIINGKERQFIAYYEKRFGLKLITMYNFCKDRTFMYMLIAWDKIDYVHELFSTEDVQLPSSTPTVLPNYVYDKHVAKSPQTQKSYKFFIDNLVLQPRGPVTEMELTAKQLYISSNASSNNYCRPTSLSTNNLHAALQKRFGNHILLQTQLITCKGKPRTFYLHHDTHYPYSHIVKGPFRKHEEVEELLLADKVKQLLINFSLNYEVLNASDGEYLMFRNLVRIDPSNTIVRNSRLETNVVTYNGDKGLFNHLDIKRMDNLERLMLLRELMFRKVIGTNDTCPRNIVYTTVNEGDDTITTIASIDDPAKLIRTKLMWKTDVPKNTLDDYRSALREAFPRLRNELKRWRLIIRDAKLFEEHKTFILARIDELSSIDSWLWTGS